MLPIKLLKDLDAVIEPKMKKLYLRSAGVGTELDELPSEHQTTSMMHFGKDGWQIPQDIEKKFLNECDGNPFLHDADSQAVGYQPSDPRFDIHSLLERSDEYVTQADLEDLLTLPETTISMHTVDSSFLSDSAGADSSVAEVPHLDNPFTRSRTPKAPAPKRFGPRMYGRRESDVGYGCTIALGEHCLHLLEPMMDLLSLSSQDPVRLRLSFAMVRSLER